jgi:multicomponent Na+:H+ antiporter subunit F
MNAFDWVLLLLVVAFFAGLLRVALGPSLADRAVAADVCLFVVVSGLAVLSLRLDAPVFLDVVLVATLLGFVATVSLARLIEGEHPRGAQDDGEPGRPDPEDEEAER